MGLFRSNGGVVLGPDICLDIVIAVIDSDHHSVGSLLRLSKDFHALLRQYERSIANTLLQTHKDDFAYANAQQDKILSSRMPPSTVTIPTLTYPWISEMKTRSETIDFLVGHELTEMTDHTCSWPTLDLPKEDMEQRLTLFKKLTLLQLYRLVDCVAGLTETHDVRSRQAEFLEGLSANDLASLGVIVEVLGQGFFNMTKGALLRSGLLDNIHVQPSSDSELYAPTSTPMEDLHNDHWIRESMCVFEDLVQRHGPYFAYAFVEGPKRGSSKRLNFWTRSMLQQGLDNMNAFEMGYTMSYASLQSVVWRKFCKRVDCSKQESWSTAKRLVETQMRGYDL